MNELLQKHGCSNVFTIPEGLKELMADITREVLRAQPEKIFDFIANYLSVLMITREHGVMAVKILQDLCDCRPSVTEHLEAAGFPLEQASAIAAIIHEEIEKVEPEEGNETVEEAQILKKILHRNPIDESMTAKVCQIARNAYREFWYRKKLLAKTLSKDPEQPWELAAAHTLEIYKKTNPTFGELNLATEKIQAAYKGYHVRRALLIHKEKPGPKKKMPGPPIDVAGSREVDLGPVISLKVGEDEVSKLFEVDVRNQLGLPYDTTRMITYAPDDLKYCSCEPLDFDEPTEPSTPRTPFPSVVPHPDKSQSVSTTPGPPRISFAPIPEAPGLASARDSDSEEPEEVAEDITADVTPRTEGDSSISGTTTLPDETHTEVMDEEVAEEE